MVWLTRQVGWHSTHCSVRTKDLTRSRMLRTWENRAGMAELTKAEEIRLHHGIVGRSESQHKGIDRSPCGHPNNNCDG